MYRIAKVLIQPIYRDTIQNPKHCIDVEYRSEHVVKLQYANQINYLWQSQKTSKTHFILFTIVLPYLTYWKGVYSPGSIVI